MFQFNDLNAGKSKFEDMYFRADTSSLSIFVINVFSIETEIVFDPLPLCYRYILEERCAESLNSLENGENQFETSCASKWLGYENFSGYPKIKQSNFYRLLVGSQAFEILSVNQPKIILHDSNLQPFVASSDEDMFLN
jgi:hypothetical protein